MKQGQQEKQSHYIYARDLPEAWFLAIEEVIHHGKKIPIDFGSYVGQTRLQLPYCTIEICYPGTRPLVPIVPAHIPAPTNMEYVEKYLEYLMAEEKKENEQYTYGERIVPQMAKIIDNYLENGFNTNQACISVSQPNDINLDDPPCLRNISIMISNNDPPELNFYVYFRSWDLWSAFSTNLGGIRLMQEYIAEILEIEAGIIIAASNGLHLYNHSLPMAKNLIGE
jgi:thymidylate synthase